MALACDCEPCTQRFTLLIREISPRAFLLFFTPDSESAVDASVPPFIHRRLGSVHRRLGILPVPVDPFEPLLAFLGPRQVLFG
jgi:hypothetical protein